MNIRAPVFFAFRSLAHLRLAGLAAQLLIYASRKMQSPEVDTHRASPRHRAVILTRGGFLDDVKESFLDADDFEVIRWPSFALKAFATAMLSPELDHNFYLSDDPKIEATKTAYRQFLAKVWQKYNATMPVDVVLTGNFAYFPEREFATVLEEAGTPFIALHKENVRPPRRVEEYWFTLYKERRGKFTGRRICVYNEIERDLEISSGVMKPDGIVVTGMPRLDRLHRWRQENAGKAIGRARPMVLFFAFSRQDKLTAIHRKATAGLPGNMEPMEGEWGKLSWGRFCEGSHKAMIDLARSRPDIDVVFKLKGQTRAKTDITEMMDGFQKPLPANLSVISTGDPLELIAQCRVAAGFNTTALLEGLAAGKPVIVPRFEEALDPEMQDLIIDLGGAVEYASSPAEFVEMVLGYIDEPNEIASELSAESRRILRYWVGNDDGHAGGRVLEVVREETVRSDEHAGVSS